MQQVALVRGGGDLGTGIAHALHQGGWRVVVVDRPLPSALRLTVAFAAAAVAPDGRVIVQGVEATRCDAPADVRAAWGRREVALWTGAEADLRLRPDLLVDARMRALTEPSTRLDEAPRVVGIGPGFRAGVDAHAVIESNRGPRLGRVITEGAAEPHTGVPGAVAGYRRERLIVAPCAGTFRRSRDLGDPVEAGDVVGQVQGEAGEQPVRAGLSGMIRGLKLSGVWVGAGHKVGDVDPRRDPALLLEMTDKARAVGRGVLEAVALLAPDERRARCT
ncbi:MAG: EF2563 family selenium-dependent molybdenum hydroxylase system protein [Planctomycetes bacterium]|nr:EF2563 family selenium-dependent molybdenum hydroxylase system protein [Planctomycetota bacterium]